MTAPENEEPGLAWDQDFADQLIGATLLVGITYLQHDGTLVRREQVFGPVAAVDAEIGITILRSDTGEPYIVAPVLEAIEPASPGHYQLTETDAVIEDPDYTVTFSVTAPLRH
ncbi:hypothetical protein MKK58_24305 [Methylobacterium sp. J-078]|jgi:hypothetical protein|uniref:hypothetical protein n=1 Tax=Methylobacterium sp. J-078 TaxID=2836657 RepID=UPI001FB99A0A|nr:hypothetical protein [Methylobacterium sp. J-078]MCJ2047638.1 hypothetical protein [Methylobacterium sp. J-078]